ncbi:hypothetical protein BHE74_00053000 [Ensete ventricosum]|nr:hypothetical protein BHE74_00053000 [Ensete ventricosum]
MVEVETPRVTIGNRGRRHGWSERQWWQHDCERQSRARLEVASVLIMVARMRSHGYDGTTLVILVEAMKGDRWLMGSSEEAHGLQATDEEDGDAGAPQAKGDNDDREGR